MTVDIGYIASFAVFLNCVLTFVCPFHLSLALEKVNIHP